MKIFTKIKHWLQGLSYRTGLWVLASCIPFYILSFAQALLPISVEMKGALWFVLFGMAKTTQYAGITIIGVDGYRRLKRRFFGKRSESKVSDIEEVHS